MKRIVKTGVAAMAAAMIVASCGGSPPSSPTPGGGGNNGGGVSPPPNTPPSIKSITASDTRVEVGTPVSLKATVEDAETPVQGLVFTWEFPDRSVTVLNSEGTVTWTPGAELKTPGDFTITLTVIERYTSGSVQAENKTSSTTTLHVNNSSKELAELSLRFLGDFANSKVFPDKCVSEFSDTPPCDRGKKSEFEDIDDNRHDFEILSSTLRHTSLSIDGNRNFATVHTFCSFTSKVITTQPREENCRDGKCPLGSVSTSTGDCYTTNVYEKGRWWLCDSHFASQNGLLSPLERAFFGIHGGQ